MLLFAKCLIVFGLLLAMLLGVTLSVPLEAPGVILLSLGALMTSTFGAGRHDYSSALPKWLGWFVVAGMVYFIGRALKSPVIDLGLADLMLILGGGGLYITAGYLSDDVEGRRLHMSAAWVVLLVLLGHVGAAVFQAAGGDGYSLSRYFTSGARASEGISGMYGYYGSFANFAVIGGLLALSMGFWGRCRVVVK
ncbi:MAG: hypothetical protein ACK5M8_21095, partial [Shewanella algae]